MKILLLGSNGQLGHELKQMLHILGHVRSYSRNDFDFSKFDTLSSCIRDFSPDVIVNAAAYTHVDQAETYQEEAYTINTHMLDVLSQESNRFNAWLIHYSTDYVFDGKKNTPYDETDTANPKSVYGNSKLNGESHILNSGCKHIIFRTSWVFSEHGTNFVKTIMDLSKKKEKLNVIEDQHGVPSSAKLLSHISLLCLYRLLYTHSTNQGEYTGIYHLTPKGETTWYRLACFIIDELKKFAKFPMLCSHIYPISSSEYPSKVDRPMNSCLDHLKLEKKFNINIPYWESGVKNAIKTLVLKEYYERS